MVMISQPYEYTKNHGVVHCKEVNFVVCEFYLNFFFVREEKSSHQKKRIPSMKRTQNH